MTGRLGFTLVREVDATPEELWRCWTDPEEAAAWWHPEGVRTLRDSVVIDARVGGRYTYTMVDPAGRQYPTGGTYLDVVAPERLVFTWGHPDAGPGEAPVITVTIEPLGDARSRLTLDLRGAAGAPGDGFIHDGWDSALTVLATHLRTREDAR